GEGCGKLIERHFLPRQPLPALLRQIDPEGADAATSIAHRAHIIAAALSSLIPFFLRQPLPCLPCSPVAVGQERWPRRPGPAKQAFHLARVSHAGLPGLSRRDARRSWAHPGSSPAFPDQALPVLAR